jgi:hypothetical protein
MGIALKTTKKLWLLAIFSLITGCGLEDVTAKSFAIEGLYEQLSFKPADENLLEKNFAGLAISYEFFQGNSLYIKLQAVAKRGDFKDDNTIINTTWLNAEERVGFSFAYGVVGSAIAVFGGLSHYWCQQKAHIQGDPKIWDSIYQGQYLPFGCSINHIFTKKTSCKLTASWLPQIYSSITINDDSRRFNTTKKNYFFEISCQYLLSSLMGINITPFLGHWENTNTEKDKETTVTNNVYNFYGIKAGFFFSF